MLGSTRSIWHTMLRQRLHTSFSFIRNASTVGFKYVAYSKPITFTGSILRIYWYDGRMWIPPMLFIAVFQYKRSQERMVSLKEGFQSNTVVKIYEEKSDKISTLRNIYLEDQREKYQEVIKQGVFLDNILAYYEKRSAMYSSR